jgi:cytochrome c oxidase subunit 3
MSSVHVAHQFDDAAQQRHAVSLGMWLFLATEVLVFSVLFTAYTVARRNAPASFAEAGGHLYKWIGVANAVVLLLSSGAMAMGVETPPDRSRAKSSWLLVTVLLGLIFLVLKGAEYTLDIHEGLLPGVSFSSTRFTDPRHAAFFLIFYWCMTGLHALHVAIGICVVAVMALLLRFGPEPEARANAVHATGLYWHFVDIVWLFLLPLLYLNP